jgi:signal transduction histidine kinase
MVVTQTAAKHLHASFASTPDTILLMADARRLKQIITNLLSNAIKFTSDGGKYGIQLAGDQALQQVRITVWDSGIGIKDEDKQRLFQSFVQLDARLSRQYSGTGLGLMLVRRLAELHGGSVELESVFGEGSRFTVTLPWHQ